MRYARLAANHFDTRHREYYVTPADIVSGIPVISSFLDQPFGNSSILPAYYCAAMARSDGVTRLLAGDGGDELFGGNSRYRFHQSIDAYYRLPAAFRHHVLELLFDGALAKTRLAGLRHVRAYVRLATTPMPDRMSAHNLISRIGHDVILDPGWLAGIARDSPLDSQRRIYDSAAADHIVNRMLFYDWKFTLADSDLPKVRTAVEINAVSVRYPFLADELVSFSLGLSPSWKVRHGQLRWFFKRALADFLPHAIIAKKKHGFGLPFGVWAHRTPALREIAGDALAGLEGRGILRKGFRDQLMSQLLPEHPAYYGELVWILTMLEQWLAIYSARQRTEVSRGGVGVRTQPA
jgi:asparagine synthase (glutamine-hydrolysing)